MSKFVDGLIEMANAAAAAHKSAVGWRYRKFAGSAVWTFTQVQATALAAEERGYEVQALRPDLGRARFFIDTLTVTGETYLVPADKRMEWQQFDVACEETSEVLPVPEWAKPVAELSHLEFEMPEEIFK
jgi:hypothetical protein